jgi:tripeptidyl-peptidase-1
MSYPVPNHFYSTAGRGPLVPDLDQPNQANNQNEPYLEFFTYMLARPDLPHTLAFSYGENEQSVPASYAKQVCDMIGQLGARGVSVLFASGDTGVGSACQSNDGSKRTRFLPTFPAACPYATSIGGTVGTGPEKAVGFSSGGFSDLWPRPKYQERAVAAYLAEHGEKWAGYYNPRGRGFPDIAAQARDFFVVDRGRAKRIGGTSASTPLVGGLVGLLNAHRLQAGQKPLGFLNPWIYEAGAQMTTDIVDGTSTGCSGVDMYSRLPTPRVAGAGWAAVKGWDPVTGVGTPLFDKMLELMPKAASSAPEKRAPAVL